MSEPPFIIALDISKTCTGICEGVAGEVPRFYSLRNDAGTDDITAMRRIGDWLIQRTKIDKPDWLFFEAPIHPGAFLGEYDEEKGKVRAKSNPATTITLAKLVGVVEFITAMKGIQQRTANVQTVRKHFLGQARPSDPKKRAMAMCRALGWDPKNADEADAGAVWHWATMTASPRFYAPVSPLLQAKINSPFDTAIKQEARHGR